MIIRIMKVLFYIVVVSLILVWQVHLWSNPDKTERQLLLDLMGKDK